MNPDDLRAKPNPDDDLGLFGPDSVTWKVHREPVLLVAGLRSFYLQALHPRAMAGVAQNSNFRSDPWGRLVRTARYVGTTVYGTTAEAEAAGRRLTALHARMRARDPQTGEEFRIDAPDLLRWVHVAEVESFLSTARRAGLRLSDAETDTYYTEQRRTAALVGLDPDTVPGTAAAVADYYREMRPHLRMTRDAAEIALFLTAPPIPWKVSRPARLWLSFGPARLAYFGIAGTAFGLLPSWARRLYGGLGLPTTDRSAELGARTLRLALNAVPRRYIEGPIYQAAQARAARLAGPDGADRGWID
ncbi:oxygenase MpaB family protein [Micromonospora sp. NPDC049523]|uniref:oxygenase MpaB family protein n=1 Tax=Micromonospora sp. NPDC049523 TaxID=3155921 RepID=UPI00341BBB8F